MRTWAGILALLMLLAPLPLPPASSASPSNVHKVFIGKDLGAVAPLGVFNNYIIAIGESELGDMLLAINMFNGDAVELASLGGMGLDDENLRMAKTEDYLLVYDDKSVAVWDDGLRFVGRFASTSISGVAMLPNNHLIAWSDSLVAVLRAPGFVYGKFYDVWEKFYRFISNWTVTPEEYMAWGGLDPDEVVQSVIEDVEATVEEMNGTIIEGPTVKLYFDTKGFTPQEIREKVFVRIVAAAMINDTLYCAGDFGTTVVVEAAATYMVESEEGVIIDTINVSYPYVVEAGMLVSVDDELRIHEVYVDVEAGASGPALAYVYVPRVEDSLAERRLKVFLPDGEAFDIPLYLSSSVSEIWLAGEFQFLATAMGIVQVYHYEDFVFSMVAERLIDVGLAGDEVFFIYRNENGVLELGELDRYSGRYEKSVVESAGEVVGAYPSGKLLFLAERRENGTWLLVATREPLATVSATFIDSHGNPYKYVISGSARVVYEDMELELSFSVNPLVLELPVDAVVEIDVEVPYGRGEYQIRVGDTGTYDYLLYVPEAIEPAVSTYVSGFAPYRNPFPKDYSIIHDRDIVKIELPGALSLDVYGSLLALLEAPESNLSVTTTVSVYRFDGIKLYSVELPGVLDRVRVYPPYMVVSGRGQLHVLDFMSGSLLASLAMRIKGYDIDVEEDYLVAWGERLAILDLRRGFTVYLTPDGRVGAAVTIGRMVYVYLETGSGTYLEVYDAVSGTLVEKTRFLNATILSHATDGVFHAVSYRTADNETYTDVLSKENGVVTIPDGPVVGVRDVGRSVNMPDASRLQGNRFTVAVVLSEPLARIYVVGLNYLLIAETSELYGADLIYLAEDFVAEVSGGVNRTSIITLRDYSAAARLTVVPSIGVSMVAASRSILAYGDSETIYMISNPTQIGKYTIKVLVYNEDGEPMDATVLIKEFGVSKEAEGGVFEAFLSVPGVYHVEVSAPFYDTVSQLVAVSDEEPEATLVVYMEPTLYPVSVSVVDWEGNPVASGEVEVEGIDVSYYSELRISREQPLMLALRAGTYVFTYTSPLYTSDEVKITVPYDTEVLFTVNRTAVVFNITVVGVDGAQQPLPNASVVIRSDDLPLPVERTTDENGTVVVVLPYGISGNITVSYKDYRTEVVDFNATEDMAITVVLKPLRGTLTVLLQEEDGSPSEGNLVIRDAAGAVVASSYVSASAMFPDLRIGVYTVEATAPDGRTASATVTVSEDNLMPSVVLTFPAKPKPLYIKLFPYLIGVALAASILVVVYRMFFRKRGPEKAKV